MMIWVVTGATGLVGQAIVKRLSTQGERVVAISRHAVEFYAPLCLPGVDFYNVDLACDDQFAIDSIEDDITLIMLAAKINVSTALEELSPALELDVYGHLRLIDQFGSHLRQGLYASSCTVYSEPEHLPVSEDSQLQPWNVYALAKIAGEVTFRELFHTLGVPLGIVRIAHVYGPGTLEKGAIYSFLNAAATGSTLHVSTGPGIIRDYLHVDDVRDGVIAAVNAGTDGTFNLGSGEALSFFKLAQSCLDHAGRGNEQPELVPGRTVSSMWLDNRRAHEAFGYTPKVTINEGLNREYNRLYGPPPGVLPRTLSPR